jgi:hypothetical protein
MIDVAFHGTQRAETRSFDTFDVVDLRDRDHGSVRLFLPLGTGQAVADAINAAIGGDCAGARGGGGGMNGARIFAIGFAVTMTAIWVAAQLWRMIG